MSKHSDLIFSSTYEYKISKPDLPLWDFWFVYSIKKREKVRIVCVYGFWSCVSVVVIV